MERRVTAMGNARANGMFIQCLYTAIPFSARAHANGPIALHPHNPAGPRKSRPTVPPKQLRLDENLAGPPEDLRDTSRATAMRASHPSYLGAWGGLPGPRADRPLALRLLREGGTLYT